MFDGGAASGEHGLVEDAEEQFACLAVGVLGGVSGGEVPFHVRGSEPVEFFAGTPAVELLHADLDARAFAGFRLAVLRQVCERGLFADAPPCLYEVEHGAFPDRLRAGEVVEVEGGVPGASRLAVGGDGEADLASAVLVGQERAFTGRGHRRLRSWPARAGWRTPERPGRPRRDGSPSMRAMSRLVSW